MEKSPNTARAAGSTRAAAGVTRAAVGMTRAAVGMTRAAGMAAALMFMVILGGPLHADDALSFRLSGELGAEAAANFSNPESVFSSVVSVPETGAAAWVDGKLVFSRAYTTLGMLDFTFMDTAVLSGASGATFEMPLFIVNELYADVNFADLLFLRLGKQRLKWGAGYVYNPSDPVNPPKDPTAVRAEREGVPALKLEIITSVVSFAAFGIVFDTLEDTGAGARLSSSMIPGTDLSLSGYWSMSESWTAALNASFAPFYEVPGWDTLQVWFEGGLYDNPRYAGFDPGLPEMPAARTGIQYSFLAGVSAALPALRTMIIGEYYHLSEGLDALELDAVYQGLASSPAYALWYAELARRPARLASDYLFLSLTQPSITDNGNPVLDHIGFSTSCLMNLMDMSVLFRHGLSTTFVKDSSVDFFVTWAAGGAGTEFGNLVSAVSAELQVKVYY